MTGPPVVREMGVTEDMVMVVRTGKRGLVWMLVLVSILVAAVGPGQIVAQAAGSSTVAVSAGGHLPAFHPVTVAARARASHTVARTAHRASLARHAARPSTVTLPPGEQCVLPMIGCPFLPYMAEGISVTMLSAHVQAARLHPHLVPFAPTTLATGIITTIAGNGSPGCTTQFTTQCYGGDGGPATSAQINLPFGVAQDSQGDLFIADTYNNVIREVMAGTGVITTVAGDNNPGCTWVSPQPGACYNGDGGPATKAALNLPTDVAVDSAGNLYIADSNNNVVREVFASTGIISTVVGYTSTAGFAGDGGSAHNALLYTVEGIALDRSGNLYISDAYNNRIREVVAATGIITTVAGTGGQGYGGDGGLATQAVLNVPAHIALDGQGNLYIADEVNDRVREVAASSGVITTVAGNGSPGCSGTNPSACFGGDGGPATQAQLDHPYGVTLDSAGNLYISDHYNNRIRNVVAATGIISTAVGNGSPGCSSTNLSACYGGDGGSATKAQIANPAGLFLDPAGNLIFADKANFRVREVGNLGSSASGGLIPWHPHHTINMGDGVNTIIDLADGHADVHIPAMSIPGRRLSLTLSATWDSILAESGITTTPHPAIVSYLTQKMSGVLTGTVVYTDASGAIWDFPYTGSLSATPPYTNYRIPLGQPWQLTTSTSGYTLTNFLSGESWTFNSQGQIVADIDAYGNSNAVNYSSGAPISETNSGGRSLYFGYAGGHFSTIQSPLAKATGNVQGQLVAYGYNSANQLTSVSWGYNSPDQVSATFGYSGTQLVTVTTGITGSNPGKTWIITYDGLGRVSYVTSPVSGTVGQVGYTPSYATVFAYNPGQTIVAEGYNTSGQLNTIYTLDAQGQAVATTDGLLHSTYYGYDADHDITGTQDANGNITYNYYQYVGPNSNIGLITQTVQPPVQSYSQLNPTYAPITTTYIYNPSTNDLIETDRPEGGKILYSYDGHHSVITTTELLTGTSGMSNAQWRGTVNQLDSFGEVTGTVDGRGITVTTSGVASLTAQASQYTSHKAYSAYGDLTSASTAPITTTLNGVTSASTPVTTTYGYDLDANKTSMISANGNTTTDGFDHLGRPITETLPQVTLYNGTLAQPTSRTIYDAQGNITQTVDANGNTTTSSFDPLERQTLSTNAVSGTTVYTYNATEQTAVQDPQGNVATDQYDAAGRVITATAPVAGVTVYAYDAANNTTAITSQTTLGSLISVDNRQYDALNRVITDTVSGPNSSAQTTSTRYDKDGNLYQTVFPASNASVNTYDLADELASTENDPAVVAMATHQEQSTDGYDAAGNQVQAIDFGGNTTTTTYDGDNRVVQTVSVTSTTTVTTTNTFDPDGNVLTTTTQTAQPGLPLQTAVDSSTYNAADWTVGTTDNNVSTGYGYDAAGQERTHTTAGGTITTTLDAEGRVISISAAGAGTTNYGYNRDDQPITASLPGGLSGAMSYDQNGQLTSWSMIGPSTGVTTSTVNLAYNYGYDGAGQVNAITTTDNNVVQTQPVTHDAQGRMIGWNSPNGPDTWGFDGDGDVISTTSYINGAIRTTVFTYSASLPKELLQQHTDTLGVDNYTYDGNGNEISEVSTDPITSPYYVNQHFYYDAQERPVTVTNVLNGATVTATLGYNGASQNITYTVVMSGQVIDKALHTYDSDGNLVQTIATTATLNSNGSIQSSGAYTDTYAYDPLGQPLYLMRQQNGTTKAYTYLADGHDSVVGLVDSAGNRVDRYQYAPYGAPVGLGFWETVPQLYRNLGTLADPGLGLNDPDGNLKNVGSGTGTLANKSGGFFWYGSYNDDPVDYGSQMATANSTRAPLSLGSASKASNAATPPSLGNLLSSSLVRTTPQECGPGGCERGGEAGGPLVMGTGWIVEGIVIIDEDLLVQDLIGETNPSFRLSEINARRIIEDYPKGATKITVDEVISKGEKNPDVRFYRGSKVILETEVKSLGDFKRMNMELDSAAQQVHLNGRVFVQVPEGTTNAQGFISRFRASSRLFYKTPIAYQRVIVTIATPSGKVLYNGPLGPVLIGPPAP